MMFRWKATAAVAVVAALALTGCAGGETETTGSDGGRADRLTLITIDAPTSYDIGAGAEWGFRSVFFEAVFDTLLRKDASGEIQPNLATEWSYNDDNTVLTLTLRDDVTFTDGTKLDAEAVVGSLERFRDGTSSQAATLAGKEFAATDATTVTITQDAPDPSLESLLSTAPGLVQAPSSFDDENSATTPVGSGPYILDSASSVTGTTYNYTANPDYWNADAVKYENLTINVMEATAILNAIKAGEANGATIVDNNAIAEVEGAGWTIESLGGGLQGLLLLDRAGTMAPELADVKVRQAINMAFDREALLQSLQSGYGTVTEQVFPETSVAYDEALDSTYGYDPDAAKALLADAGYPDGFTLNMMSLPTFQTTFDLVAQQLADIGITVKYTPGTGNNFITDMLAPKYPAAWMALETQIPDWQLINLMVGPAATFNPFKYQDDTVDGLIETVQFGTEEESTTALKELNAYLVDQAWFAPVFRSQAVFAVDANTELAFWSTNVYPSIFAFSPKN